MLRAGFAQPPAGQFRQQRPRGVQDCGHIVRARLAGRTLEQQRHSRREPDSVHESVPPAIHRIAVRGGQSSSRPFRGGRIPLSGFLRGGRILLPGLFRGGRVPLRGRACPETGWGRREDVRRGLGVRDAGDRRQSFVGRARQLGLDLGQLPSFGLTALDRYQLQQVPPPVPGDPAPPAQRRIHQADGDVPANQPFVRHIADPPVRPRRSRPSRAGRCPAPAGRSCARPGRRPVPGRRPSLS